MRRYSLLAISLTGLATTAFLFWHLSPASAADDVKTIEIVKNADGKFVFSDPNAKITAGQSVKWVAKDADVPHQLVPDTEDDALTDTSTFDSSTTPTQKFKAAGTIHYHCVIHLKSMKGTITVTAAAEAPAEPEKPPAKAPPKPSYDPY